MKKTRITLEPSDREMHGRKPEPTQKRPPIPPSQNVARKVVSDEYEEQVKINLSELELSEYEMIIETLMLRRKQIHWSTDINKEITVNKYDLLIEKLVALEG